VGDIVGSMDETYVWQMFAPTNQVLLHIGRVRRWCVVNGVNAGRLPSWAM
jgi:hypothetical protein